MVKYRFEVKKPVDTKYESFTFEQVHRPTPRTRQQGPAKECVGVTPEALCEDLKLWLKEQQIVDQAKEVNRGVILNSKFIPVCIAACNEEADGVCKTIHHIMKMFEFINLAMYKDTEEWRETRTVLNNLKPLIVIVCDGAQKLSPSMRNWLHEKHPDLLAEVGDGNPSAPGEVDVKIGCRTWYHDCEAAVKRGLPITERALDFKMAVIVKRENHRKHNSHDWFFQFCRGLGESVDHVLLTDAETSFRHDCLAQLVKELHFSPELIAVTGQMFCEAPCKYFHPCEESLWSCLHRKHGPTEASPCMSCYLTYYGFSPAPVQAFECIVSVLINSLVFNVVEALPCMPGPCQLLRWKEVVAHGVVEKYFSYLLGQNERLPEDQYEPYDIEGAYTTEICMKCDCDGLCPVDAASISTLTQKSLESDPLRKEEGTASSPSSSASTTTTTATNPMSPPPSPLSAGPPHDTCRCACHSGEKPEREKTDVLKENSRIGEDRMFSNFLVYCSGLGTRIVPDAIFFYEPMLTWIDYLVQRRRWINGATAATWYFFSHESARMRIEATTFANAQRGAQHPRYVDPFWCLQLIQTVLLVFSLSLFASASYGGLNSMAEFSPALFGWALDEVVFPHHRRLQTVNSAVEADLTTSSADSFAFESTGRSVLSSISIFQPSLAPTLSPSLSPTLSPTALHAQNEGIPDGTITWSHVWVFAFFAYFAIWQTVSFYWSDIADWYQERYEGAWGKKETKTMKIWWEEGFVLTTAWFGFAMSVPIYLSMFYSLWTHGWMLPAIFMLVYLLATPALAIFTNKWVIGQYVLLTFYFLVAAVFILVMIPAYSLARIWDTSWGTRGSTNEHDMSPKAKASVKTWTKWICCIAFFLNIVTGWILSLIHYLGATTTDLLIVLMSLPMMILVAFGLGYRIVRLLWKGYLEVKDKIEACYKCVSPTV